MTHRWCGSPAVTYLPNVSLPAYNQGMQLVLSLFPGVGLLDRAFREAGFCVVTGPDRIIGGDVREFAAVPGKFDGIIGGPPCQGFSQANRHASDPSHESVVNSRAMVGEFLRVVRQANPTWFLMENVPRVPDVREPGFEVQRFAIDVRECGSSEQIRLRHFQFGHRDGWICRPKRNVIQCPKLGPVPKAVTAKQSSKWTRFADLCRRQGVPELALNGWTKQAKMRAVGNGVPLPMGRVVAEAVRSASVRTVTDCPCGCGRQLTGKQRSATCRKTLQTVRAGSRDVITLRS